MFTPSLLGQFLHYLRNRAGYTREEAAEKLQLTMYVYANYESGRLVPGLTTLEKIGNLYHVPFENMVKVALESEKRIIGQKKTEKRENASDHE